MFQSFLQTHVFKDTEERPRNISQHLTHTSKDERIKNLWMPEDSQTSSTTSVSSLTDLDRDLVNHHFNSIHVARSEPRPQNDMTRSSTGRSALLVSPRKPDKETHQLNFRDVSEGRQCWSTSRLPVPPSLPPVNIPRSWSLSDSDLSYSDWQERKMAQRELEDMITSRRHFGETYFSQQSKSQGDMPTSASAFDRSKHHCSKR